MSTNKPSISPVLLEIALDLLENTLRFHILELQSVHKAFQKNGIMFAIIILFGPRYAFTVISHNQVYTHRCIM